MTSLEIPIDLSRSEARRLAEIELADPAYAAAQPGLIQRAIDWLVDRLQRAMTEAGDLVPGGWLGILGLLFLVVIAVIVIRWRMGPVSRSAAVTFTVDPATTAEQYRRRSDELAAAGAWAEAITERMRALARGAQEQGMIAEQVGLTADELAADLARLVPEATATLLAAARAFDEVRYGGHVATAGGLAKVVAADEEALGVRARR